MLMYTKKSVYTQNFPKLVKQSKNCAPVSILYGTYNKTKLEKKTIHMLSLKKFLWLWKKVSKITFKPIFRNWSWSFQYKGGSLMRMLFQRCYQEYCTFCGQKLFLWSEWFRSRTNESQLGRKTFPRIYGFLE